MTRLCIGETNELKLENKMPMTDISAQLFTD